MYLTFWYGPPMKSSLKGVVIIIYTIYILCVVPPYIPYENISIHIPWSPWDPASTLGAPNGLPQAGQLRTLDGATHPRQAASSAQGNRRLHETDGFGLGLRWCKGKETDNLILIGVSGWKNHQDKISQLILSNF